MAAVTICIDFGAQKYKVSHCFIVSPSISHEVMGPDAMKLKYACSLEESYDLPRQHTREQRHYFANKGLSIQSYGFLQ